MTRSEKILCSVIVVAWLVALSAFLLAVPAEGYDRDNWRHWIDADGDRQHTRYEVLIDESTVWPTMTNGKPTEGIWLCLYTGAVLRDASSLDVDHMIPLSYVANRGGEKWSPERKRLYANATSDPDHLVAVLASANRQKGGQGPSEWMPAWIPSWCWYADAWERIAATWGIPLDQADVDKIAEVRELEACR
jgi:hypothetical protein